MYILMALGLALQDARARLRRAAVQPPAQPRLVVACLGLIARLQLLLPLPHQHAHQVFLDSLHYVRGACKLGRYVRLRLRVDQKMVKNWGVSSISIS